jgi:hypothetical protein
MRSTTSLLVFTALPFFAPIARADEPAPELSALLNKAAQYRPGARDLAWREIPWNDDPATALKEARAEKRPLLVWLAGGRDRDGTPLERC